MQCQFAFRQAPLERILRAAAGVRAAPGCRPAIAPRRGVLHTTASMTGHAVDDAYGEIDFRSLAAGEGHLRVRQHVNPLKKELQVPTPPPADWRELFADPSRPLVVDIGCGYGRFLMALAAQRAEPNMLGLEIRAPVVDRANKWASKLGVTERVRFLRANATVSLSGLLESYPGPVTLVTVLHPDPHFKKRHRKRRVVQPELVAAVAQRLVPGGQLLLQSDVLEVAADMRDQFERHAREHFELAQQHAAPGGTFEEALPPEPDADEGEGSGEQGGEGGAQAQPALTWGDAGWLVDNPLGVPTEREVNTLDAGGRVYRVLLTRK